MSRLFPRRVALATLALAAATCAQAASYRIVDLGAYTQPKAINNHDGDIAGDADGRAAVYRGRTGHGKLLPDPNGDSDAQDIDELGDIVGSSTPSGTQWEQPVLWIRHGGWQNLPLPAGAFGGQGTALARDQVVYGFYYPSDFERTGDPRCFRWSAADGVVDIGLAKHAHACLVYGANAQGQVVGESYVGKTAHAFLYENGAFRGLGTLPGGSYSWADAVNRHGHVVGGADAASGEEHAFFWSDGRMSDIGAGSAFAENFAIAINDDGEAVGTGYLSDQDNVGAALRFADGQVIDLNTEVDDLADWHLGTAFAINDAGAIVGLGTRGGVPHGYELVPLAAR